MKKGSERRLSKAKMPLSSHFPGPSSLRSSMRSRSLSPLIGSETQPLHPGGQWPAQAELTDESTVPLEPQQRKGAESYVGVRYITEALIKKLTKQDNLALVKSLNLSLSKDGGKKFRYIENLEKCVKLEVLNLSYNLIVKIEKVDKLLRLRELNLSYNKISKIEGLENMCNLQKLNLAGNEIEQKQENSCMQKEMATIELVAQDNHERARRLMKELSQMQQEYLELKKQVANQKDLERRQMEVSDAMRTLKSEVKDEIRTSLRNLNQFLPELPADLASILERNENLRELESLKENFPFTTKERIFEEKSNFPQVHIMDEHWRGEALRQRLRRHEDQLKAQLRHCMSKQAEVLIKGKQQTEGTLHSLRRQVDALGELVTSTSTDSASSPSLPSLVEDSQHGHSQSSFQVLQVPLEEPNSYRH